MSLRPVAASFATAGGPAKLNLWRSALWQVLLTMTIAGYGVGTVFAAMAPCMRLYAWLGAALDAGAAGPYAQWVQTYADPNFEVSATRLERLLDEQADDRPAVRAAYRRAMHLELAFFDAALLPSG